MSDDDFSAPEEDRLTRAVPTRNDVQTMVYAVNQIDVGMARLTPHAADPDRPTTTVGVAGGIGWTEIRFNFGQAHSHPPRCALSYEDLSDQIFGHIHGRTLIECPPEWNGATQVAS